MSADVTDASLSLLVPGCNSATPLDRMAPIPKVLLSSRDRPFMSLNDDSRWVVEERYLEIDSNMYSFTFTVGVPTPCLIITHAFIYKSR